MQHLFNTLIYNFRKHEVKLDILFKRVYLQYLDQFLINIHNHFYCNLLILSFFVNPRKISDVSQAKVQAEVDL